MAVPDGTLLGVAETDDSFVAPDPLAGTTARHFRRYPRPSQGILTGRPTTGLLVVWISPLTAERTQAAAGLGRLRPHQGDRRRRRSRLHPDHPLRERRPATDPRFMHFYEMDSDDPEATFQTMAEHLRVRLGGYRTPQFKQWADWTAAGAEIIYVNTFRLLGSARRPDLPGRLPV